MATKIGTDDSESVEGTSGDDSLRGEGGDDSIYGRSGDDYLDGGDGFELLAGGAGRDTIYGRDDDDFLFGYEAWTEPFFDGMDRADELHGGRGNDFIFGGEGNDQIFGESNDDFLKGDAGADTIDGGSGNDIARYWFDTLGRTAGVSFDASIVGTAETVTLVDEFGNRDTLISIERVNLIGTGFADTLTSGSGDDQISDGDGKILSGVTATGDNDTIRSGDGDDLIYLNYGNDSVSAGAGNDYIAFYGTQFYSAIEVGNSTVNGCSGDDTASFSLGNGVYVINSTISATLDASDMGAVSVTVGDSSGVHTLIGIERINVWGTEGRDSFIASSGNDVVYGYKGADTLDGGIGADFMDGGEGSDTYTVDNVADTIIDTTPWDRGDIDTVRARIDWTLGDGLENLSLIGTAPTDGTGNGRDNRITGNSGNNRLNGKQGDDTLVGGLGNDTYTVTSAGDVVTETSTLVTEIDTVKANLAWTLGLNLENLTLFGTGNIAGYGNSRDNVLTGNASNNTLDGRDGADTMVGGLGNDTYTVTSIADVVTETSTAAGEIDLVKSSVSFALSGTQVENLTLIGTGSIMGTGSSHDNVLVGNTGNNVLNAGAGNDTMTGGTGADDFELRSTTGSDLVTDFLSGTDDLRVMQSSLSIGDGDAIVEGARRIAGPGGFAASAELVILTADIAGDITTNRAAVAIGSADSNYAVGATRIFVVDNGTDSAVYLFTASNADARVSAAELTLLATLQGTAALATADIEFGG